MTTQDREAAVRAIERAEKVVDDLCHGRIRWIMRVPAEPDRDPDLVISRALALARQALAPALSRESTPEPDPEADDAPCGCGAIGVYPHTNAQHYALEAQP